MDMNIKSPRQKRSIRGSWKGNNAELGEMSL
jgi:hypothetical protein